MKVILAVSGGVDSMVMLDLFMHHVNNSDNCYSSGDIIVAHFDHGIRENSVLDAEFVRHTSLAYGCKFYLGQAKLGDQASEAMARENRYNFLRQLAVEQSDDGQPVQIATAHHLNDLAETVIVNFLRGTGWRGLAALDSSGILRPFLEPNFFANITNHEIWSKQDILRYAGEHQIVFREDQSNSSDAYLRNRIRQQMNNSINFEKIFQLWKQQKDLKKAIDQTIDGLLLPDNSEWPRTWFQNLDQDMLDREVALELLRAGTLQVGISATRPQLENLRQAILSYKPGKYFNLPGDKLVKMKKNSFALSEESLMAGQ